MSKGTCLICFAENIKIFDIRNTYLESVYKEMVDSMIQTKSFGLCSICRTRLQQYYQLVKLAVNLQRSPQDGCNKVEYKPLVQLSAAKIEETTLPYHCGTITQELDVKEETAVKLEKDGLEDNPEIIKHDEARITTFNGIHTNDNSYICDICNKSFIRRDHLTIHRRMHTVEKLYSCDICSKKSTQKSNLTTHRRTHTKEKPYSCDICSKKFIQKSGLTTHKRTHTRQKSYSCAICDKSFSRSDYLIKHIKTHTGEKSYSCDLCNKTFSRSVYLTRHRRTHSGVKPYSCNICYKSFRRSDHLKRHRKMHTG